MSAGIRTVPVMDVQPLAVLTNTADGDTEVFTNPGYAGLTILINVSVLTSGSCTFTAQGRDVTDNTLTYPLGTGDATADVSATGLHVIHIHPALTAAAASSGVSVAKRPAPFYWSLDINVTSAVGMVASVVAVYHD